MPLTQSKFILCETSPSFLCVFKKAKKKTKCIILLLLCIAHDNDYWLMVIWFKCGNDYWWFDLNVEKDIFPKMEVWCSGGDRNFRILSVILLSHSLIGGTSKASNDRCTTCNMHDTIIATHMAGVLQKRRWGMRVELVFFFFFKPTVTRNTW